MLGDNLNLTCVAAGSPMPRVKWRKGVATDLTPEDQIPIGRNILKLTNIQESENYTCIASSVMALIETTTLVKVQCKSSAFSLYPNPSHTRHRLIIIVDSAGVELPKIKIGAHKIFGHFLDETIVSKEYVNLHSVPG